MKINKSLLTIYCLLFIFFESLELSAQEKTINSQTKTPFNFESNLNWLLTYNKSSVANNSTKNAFLSLEYSSQYTINSNFYTFNSNSFPKKVHNNNGMTSLLRLNQDFEDLYIQKKVVFLDWSENFNYKHTVNEILNHEYLINKKNVSFFNHFYSNRNVDLNYRENNATSNLGLRSALVNFSSSACENLEKVQATTQPICGNSTGTIKVTAPLESPGVNFTLSSSNTNFISVTQESSTFSGLAPGEYTITSTDSKGCTTTGFNITIEPAKVIPNPPTVNVSSSPSCTSKKATIEITVFANQNLESFTATGPKPDLTSITSESGIFTGELSSGTYDITVTNTSGCTSTAKTITIAQQPSIPGKIVATISDADCDNKGKLVVTSPIADNILYSIKKGNNNASEFTSEKTYTNLEADNYVIIARNTISQCESTSATYNFSSQKTKPDVAFLSITQPGCESEGTIEVTSPKGNGIQYAIKKTDTTDLTKFVANPIFTNLKQGSYIVLTQSSNGCTSETTIPSIINLKPTKPEVVSVKLIDADCDNKGIIEVISPLNENAANDLQYSIIDEKGLESKLQLSPLFRNLEAGSYRVKATNSFGCFSEDLNPTKVQEQPKLPGEVIVVATPPTCTNLGIITVKSPLDNGITYSKDGINFQTELEFNNLNEGNYTIIAKAENGCARAAATVQSISAPPTIPMIAKASVVKPSCTENSIIKINSPLNTTIQNGILYSIDGENFQTRPEFSGLSAGDYNIIVKGANGCVSITSEKFTVQSKLESGQIKAEVSTPPSCILSTGTITVNQISNSTGSTYTLTVKKPIITTITNDTGVFSGLSSGEYDIISVNNNGCKSNVLTLTIGEAPTTPQLPVVELTQPTCITKGIIKVISPAGSGFTYSIDDTNFQPNSAFNELDSKDYTITVKNSQGCTSKAITKSTILPKPLIPDKVTATVSEQPSCSVSTGTIIVTKPDTGVGTTYTISSLSTIKTIKNDTGIFKGLNPDDYEVTTTNSSNCTSTRIVLSVTEGPKAPSSALPISSIGTNECPFLFFDLKSLEPTSIKNVSYEWWTGTASTRENQIENTNVSESGNYFLWAKSEEGCYNSSNSSFVTVSINTCGEDNLLVYNGLSPNGDGNNDFFRIQNIDLYPDNTVSIYNRWGVLVYEVQGYKNDINTPVFKGFSDGRVTISKGTLLPEGTYFYIIRYVNSASEVKERSGYLYLNQ